jgi:hypothetical protein
MRNGPIRGKSHPRVVRKVHRTNRSPKSRKRDSRGRFCTSGTPHSRKGYSRTPNIPTNLSVRGVYLVEALLLIVIVLVLWRAVHYFLGG